MVPATKTSSRRPTSPVTSNVSSTHSGPEVYAAKHKIRIVTAASLFDGHDAAINVMRRIMQAAGAEVIHLGHNRSVAEIVNCAIQEDVQGIAITSYQGGHVEYFKYMIDLLRERGAHIKVFGGGGGTILPSRDRRSCTRTASTRIYSPDDGRAMGLQGMINDLLRQCDFAKPPPVIAQTVAALPEARDRATIGGLITAAENHPAAGDELRDGARAARSRSARRSRCSASPAPAARASRASSTSWCGASCATSRTRRSP